MNKPLLMFMTAIAVMVSGAVPTSAQDAVAEVETWRGASLKIMQPSLDVLYTIVPAPLIGPTGAPTAGSGGTMGAARSGGSGSVASASVGAGPPPIQARREATSLTFVRDGIEIRVPLD